MDFFQNNNDWHWSMNQSDFLQKFGLHSSDNLAEERIADSESPTGSSLLFVAGLATTAERRLGTGQTVEIRPQSEFLEHLKMPTLSTKCLPSPSHWMLLRVNIFL